MVAGRLLLPGLALFLVCAPAALQAAATNRHEPHLALGTVSFLGNTTCLTGATKGASCISIKVSCPNVPALQATVAIANPVGTAAGTIVLLSGNTGAALYNSGFATPYLSHGFRVVQVGWTSDWQDTGGVGLKSAGCRPATVFQWLFNGVHGGSRTTGFCAQGISGGGIQVAYSLAEYGLADYFDYVVMGSAPGFARIDYGCDAFLYTGGPLNLCSLLPNAPYAFPHGEQEDLYENTTSCSKSNPPQSDIDKWASDSIISTGADFSYPQTDLSLYFCTTPPLVNSTGEGFFYIQQLMPKSAPDVNCYEGTCKLEAVWTDPDAFNLAETQMLSRCVPNHQN